MQSTGSSFAAVAIQQWVGQTCDAVRAQHQLAGPVVGGRPQRLRPEPGRLRRLGHPLQLAAGPVHPELPLPVHARRGRRPLVHVQPQRQRRPADQQPQHRTPRSSTRSSWARSPPGTTRPSPPINPQLQGDLPEHQDRPRLPDRRLRGELPALRLPAASGRGQLHRRPERLPGHRHPRRRPAQRQLADPDARRLPRPDGLPGMGGRQPGGPERLGQRRQLRVVPVEPGFDHLRGDRLRQGAQLPGGLPAERERDSTSSPPRSTWPPRWRRPNCTPT